MTTIYRRRDSSKTLRRILTALGVFALLMGAGYVGRSAIEDAMTRVFPSLWRGSDRGAGVFMSISSFFEDKVTLIQERDALRAQLTMSQFAVLDRNLIYEENVALKERLGRSVAPNALLAAVLVRPPETPYDTLIIDAGESSSVAVGDRVAAEGTLLVGYVEAVYAHTARVKLHSYPGATYDAFLRGTVPIRVEGIGGGSLRAEVPHDAQATAGDQVLLPMTEANLSFVIEHVEAGQGDSAATVYLQLPVNPTELRFVEVWRSVYAQ